MTKRVTNTKMVRASNALLALVDCDDLRAVLDAHRLSIDGHVARWTLDELPTVESLLTAAHTLSCIAVPDEQP